MSGGREFSMLFGVLDLRYRSVRWVCICLMRVVLFWGGGMLFRICLYLMAGEEGGTFSL